MNRQIKFRAMANGHKTIEVVGNIIDEWKKWAIGNDISKQITQSPHWRKWIKENKDTILRRIIQ